MSLTRFGHESPGLRFLLASCVLALLSSCALNELPNESTGTGLAQGTLNGMGASSMSVAQENWIALFQTENPRATVIYAPEGSGAGRDSFAGGGTHFAGTDRPLHVEENVPGGFAGCADDSPALDLPVYVSPIAVAYNVDGVDDLRLSPDVLAAIFLGEISSWADGRIAELNPDAALPDLQVTAVHRSDDSGTTENFSAYLHAAAGEVWDAEPSGTWPSTAGEAAKGTSGVISAVRDGVGTIGYVDASQAGGTRTASIGGGDVFEAPTPEAAGRAVAAAPVQPGRPLHDLALELSPDVPGYPIVLISYALVCEEYRDPATAELVKEYFRFAASAEGQRVAADGAGAAPLPDGLRRQVLGAVESIR